MKITLKTRCGCSREWNLPLPLPDFVLIPLSAKASLFHIEMDAQACDPSRPHVGIRRFDRYGSTREYIETAHSYLNGGS